MKELYNILKVEINAEHTFFLDMRNPCKFSGTLEKMVEQENASVLAIEDFPGGPQGFELVSRFCYSNGSSMVLTPQNIIPLFSSAHFLEMTEEISSTFSNVLFSWSWADIVTSLKNYEPVFSTANSSGLLDKLISSLLLNISNSDVPLTGLSSFSSASSSSLSSLASGAWWSDDFAVLSPNIITKIMRNLNESNEKSFVLTRFLLHYLKSTGHKSGSEYKLEYSEIADTVVNDVVSMGRGAVSCRRLFWVLRVVSGLNLSSNSREQLEELIGERFDEATLDDLLVSGHGDGVYDVSLVIRLVKIFVRRREMEVSLKSMRRVGMLMDMYLKEISPDKNLNVRKFVEVAVSLPESARGCVDGIYRALCLYIEAHPMLSFAERTMLCQCINHEKLTLDVSKELARNPKIPPQVSMQALVSQLSDPRKRTDIESPSEVDDDDSSSSAESANEEKKESMIKFGMMRWRLCRDARGKISKNADRGKIISFNVGN